MDKQYINELKATYFLLRCKRRCDNIVKRAGFNVSGRSTNHKLSDFLTEKNVFRGITINSKPQPPSRHPPEEEI